jgi:hypothetical protein
VDPLYLCEGEKYSEPPTKWRVSLSIEYYLRDNIMGKERIRKSTSEFLILSYPYLNTLFF